MAAVMQNIKIAKGMKFIDTGSVCPHTEGQIYTIACSRRPHHFGYEPPYSGDAEETLRDPEKRVLFKPAYDDAEGWSAFVPAEDLPDTGPKDFKVGEVYVYGLAGSRGVFLIQEVGADGNVRSRRRLDGDGFSWWLPRRDSANGRHSALIFTADEPAKVVEPKQPEPLTNAEWLALPQTAALLGEIDARITPLRKAIRRRLDTIEKTIVPGAALSEVSLLDREKAALREWEDVRDLIGAIGR